LDFQIRKNFGLGCGLKNFGTRAESQSENLTPANRPPLLETNCLDFRCCLLAFDCLTLHFALTRRPKTSGFCDVPLIFDLVEMKFGPTFNSVIGTDERLEVLKNIKNAFLPK